MAVFVSLPGNAASPSAITTSTLKGIAPTTSDKIIETTTNQRNGASVDQVTLRSPDQPTSSSAVGTNDDDVVAKPEQTNRVQLSAKSINNILIGKFQQLMCSAAFSNHFPSFPLQALLYLLSSDW